MLTFAQKNSAGSHPAHRTQPLQRQVKNQAVQRLLRESSGAPVNLQAKLTVQSFLPRDGASGPGKKSPVPTKTATSWSRWGPAFRPGPRSPGRPERSSRGAWASCRSEPRSLAGFEVSTS
jgi:hypothetical protein